MNQVVIPASAATPPGHAKPEPRLPAPCKPLLAGLLGATMAFAAWAGPLPAQGPARAGLVGDETDACEQDLREIWLQMRRYDTITVPDFQDRERRSYWIQDFDEASLRLDHGDCTVQCSGTYPGLQASQLARGSCRWLPGDWGASIRFFGGCAQDQHEMADQIALHGSIAVRDERRPESPASLMVFAMDAATASLTERTCAARCAVPGLPPGMCRWKLFDWGSTISRSPSAGEACLGDYSEIQQQMLYYDSVQVPDADDPETLSRAVTRLIGAPELADETCVAACATRWDPPGSCTWTVDRWGQSIRYRKPPAGTPPTRQPPDRGTTIRWLPRPSG